MKAMAELVHRRACFLPSSRVHLTVREVAPPLRGLLFRNLSLRERDEIGPANLDIESVFITWASGDKVAVSLLVCRLVTIDSRDKYRAYPTRFRIRSAARSAIGFGTSKEGCHSRLIAACWFCCLSPMRCAVNLVQPSPSQCCALIGYYVRFWRC